MSVASEITRLQGAKASLKASINAKTDAQHQIASETLEDYSDFVDSIQTGGGSSQYIAERKSKSIQSTATSFSISFTIPDGYDYYDSACRYYSIVSSPSQGMRTTLTSTNISNNEVTLNFKTDGSIGSSKLPKYYIICMFEKNS